MTSLGSSSCEREDTAHRHECQDDDDPNGKRHAPARVHHCQVVRGRGEHDAPIDRNPPS